MDTAIWTYLDDRHPVYDRPSDAEAWQFAPEGLEPQEYEAADDAVDTDGGQPYPQSETLSMDVTSLPSLEWRQGPSGNTILTFSLNSQHAADMDLTEIVNLARGMHEDFRVHSRGPLTYDDLADLNHPYGYGQPGEALTWEKLTRPRKVPRYVDTLSGRKSLGHPTGIRGSVPTMSVVNRHTGEFDAAWRWSYALRGDGVTLSFWNERKSDSGAPIAWFLAHGTVKMQAHGPWNSVPRRHWAGIVSAWRQAAQRAAQERALSEGIFGAGDFGTMQRAGSVRRSLVG